MTSYVALLRGINVGGSKLIKMAELREMAASLGLINPRTLLQSGNLLCESDGSAAELELQLEGAISATFGFDVACLVKSSAQWQDMMLANPFPREAELDPSHLVAIVAKVPFDEALAASVRERSTGPEKLQIAGGCLFVAYPEGIGKSQLHTVKGWKEFAAAGTARNWNTVVRIGREMREVR